MIKLIIPIIIIIIIIIYVYQKHQPKKVLSIPENNDIDDEIIEPKKYIDHVKWFYSLPETCKENTANCLKHEDLRFSKHNPEIDL